VKQVIQHGYFCEGEQYTLLCKKYKVSIFGNNYNETVLVVDSDSMRVIAEITAKTNPYEGDEKPELLVSFEADKKSNSAKAKE